MYLVKSETRFISRHNDSTRKIINFPLNDLTNTSSRVIKYLNQSASTDTNLRAGLWFCYQIYV